jgi:hypothetical protein
MGSLFSELLTVAKTWLVKVGHFWPFRGHNRRKFGQKIEKFILENGPLRLIFGRCNISCMICISRTWELLILKPFLRFQKFSEAKLP